MHNILKNKKRVEELEKKLQINEVDLIEKKLEDKKFEGIKHYISSYILNKIYDYINYENKRIYRLSNN